MNGPNRLLVTRTDKLGDFMLTWPALADARAALPDARIDVLVGSAIAEIAGACPYIDEVVVDSGGSTIEMRHHLRTNRYDAAVALFSTARVAQVLWGAGISYRLGPATKLHQLFFNHRLKQRRSLSLKPEYEYNHDLIRQLLLDHEVAMPEAWSRPPFWKPASADLERTGNQLAAAYAIAQDTHLVIIHPGSGGSAKNLSIEQYAELVNGLKSDRPLFILITAGPGEDQSASALLQLIRQHQAAVHVSTDGLVAFAHVIAQARLFISGSTGPLHIAGALNCQTLAFYPRKRSSTPLRWQTINEPSRRLAFAPPEQAGESDMQAIDIGEAAIMASQQFLQGKPNG